MPVIEANFGPMLEYRQQSSPPANATNGSSSSFSGNKSHAWIAFIVFPVFMLVFCFILIMIWTWRHRKDPIFPENDKKPDDRKVEDKPEMDGRDIRFEAGHLPHGAEMDTDRRAELHGCVVPPQLLENTTVAVEMGSDIGGHEVSAETTHLDDDTTSSITTCAGSTLLADGTTSPALTHSGSKYPNYDDSGPAIEK